MSSNETLIVSLKYAATQINRHGAISVILFGTIGNLLNIFVLNDQYFYQNPCTIYLWWSSISSIFFIWSGLLTRVLEGYGINWPNQNEPICKIRLFILMVCWSMATWSFAGASFDRYLCSSPSAIRRLKSSIRTARCFLLVILIISILLFVEIFYCYKASVPNVPVACYTESLPCQLYNDWVNILFDIVIPSSFMAVFGLLTILNVRNRIIHPSSQGTVVPATNQINTQMRLKKIDRNLRKILLIQILILLLLNLPIGIQRFYASVTANLSKSLLRTTIENLLYSIIVLIRFFAYSIPFYINILSGSIFRSAFKRQILKKLGHIRLAHNH